MHETLSLSGEGRVRWCILHALTQPHPAGAVDPLLARRGFCVMLFLSKAQEFLEQ